MSILVLLVILVIFLFGIAVSASDSPGFSGFCGGVVLSTILALCIKINNPIKPIEVYQGKTELEYTVRGGEIVDSCVVYKKN